VTYAHSCQPAPLRLREQDDPPAPLALHPFDGDARPFAARRIQAVERLLQSGQGDHLAAGLEETLEPAAKPQVAAAVLLAEVARHVQRLPSSSTNGERCHIRIVTIQVYQLHARHHAEVDLRRWISSPKMRLQSESESVPERAEFAQPRWNGVIPYLRSRQLRRQFKCVHHAKRVSSAWPADIPAEISGTKLPRKTARRTPRQRCGSATTMHQEIPADSEAPATSGAAYLGCPRGLLVSALRRRADLRLWASSPQRRDPRRDLSATRQALSWKLALLRSAGVIAYWISRESTRRGDFGPTPVPSANPVRTRAECWCGTPREWERFVNDPAFLENGADLPWAYVQEENGVAKWRVKIASLTRPFPSNAGAASVSGSRYLLVLPGCSGSLPLTSCPSGDPHLGSHHLLLHLGDLPFDSCQFPLHRLATSLQSSPDRFALGCIHPELLTTTDSLGLPRWFIGGTGSRLQPNPPTFGVSPSASSSQPLPPPLLTRSVWPDTLDSPEGRDITLTDGD